MYKDKELSMINQIVVIAVMTSTVMPLDQNPVFCQLTANTPAWYKIWMFKPLISILPYQDWSSSSIPKLKS